MVIIKNKYDMKKNYTKPETQAVNIETRQILCQSAADPLSVIEYPGVFN